MNILYLSHLSGAKYAGPTYSVPKQIQAQAKIDNVFWFNGVKTHIEEWKKLSYYYDLTDFSNETLSQFPSPFNNPDLIVIESFYNMVRSKFMKELIKGKIPYIIIPRGELTEQAQQRKQFKKKVANVLICEKYAKKALAIQYLTEQESINSGTKWNKNSIIIPNGVESTSLKKNNFNSDSIRCISIGRIEPYHKGLDLLIDACKDIKGTLLNLNCSINIYGPDNEKKLSSLIQQVNNYGLDEIIRFPGAVYGDEKREELLKSDIFIIPSRFEGHPMTLIQALSYGLPCLATTGSNMRKEIEKYNAGWTADNNAESIANAFLAMVNERKLFYEKSKNAIKLSQNYEWDFLAQQSHNIFEKLINNKGGME